MGRERDPSDVLRGRGERKETERTVAQGKGIIRLKEFPVTHSIAVSDT